MEITRNTLFKLKTFEVSIGQRIDQVAIFSKSNGLVMPLSRSLRSKKLRKVKRLFKHRLNDDRSFFFSSMKEAMPMGAGSKAG